MPDRPVTDWPESPTHDRDHQDIDDRRGWSYPLPQFAVNRMYYHLVSYHGMHGDPRIGDDDADLDPGNIMHFFRQHHDNEGTPTGSMTVHKTASEDAYTPEEGDYVIDDAGIGQLGTRGKHWDVSKTADCPRCKGYGAESRLENDPRFDPDCPTCEGRGEVLRTDDELSEARHKAIDEHMEKEGFFPGVWHAEGDAPLEDWRLCDHYKETNDPRFEGFRYKAYRSRIDPRGPERSTCQNCGQPCHLQFHDKFWVHDDTSDMFHPLYHATRRGLDCDLFDSNGDRPYISPLDKDRPPEQREASIEDDHKPSYEPTGFIDGIPYSIASCSCSWKTNIRSQAASEAAWARHFKGVDEEGRREQAGEPREDAFVPRPTKRWGPVESAVTNNGCKRCGGWGTIQIPRTMPDSVDPRNPQGLGSSYVFDPSERGALAPDNPRNLQPGKWSVQMLCPVCRGVNSSEWWKESKTATRWGTCECGHSFDDHGSNPPHTGFMWCEGAGMEKIGEGGVGYGDPRYHEDDPRAGGPDYDWKCRCREFDGDELDDNGKPIISKVAMEGYPPEDVGSSRDIHPSIKRWADRNGLEVHLHEYPDIVTEAGEPDSDAYAGGSGPHIFHHPDIDQDDLDALACHELAHSIQVSHGRMERGGRDTVNYEQEAWDLGRKLHDQLGLQIPQDKWDSLANPPLNTYKTYYNRHVPERLRFPIAHREGDPRYDVWKQPELGDATYVQRRQWMQDHLVGEHGADASKIPVDPYADSPNPALFNAYLENHRYEKDAALTPEQRGPREPDDPRGHVVLPKKPRGGMKFHLLEWHNIDRDDPWYSTSEWADSMDDEHYAIHEGSGDNPGFDGIDTSNHRHAAWIDHVTSPVDPAALPQEEESDSPRLPPLYEGGYQIWPDQPEAERTPRAPANVLSGPKTGGLAGIDHDQDHKEIESDLEQWYHLLTSHDDGDPRMGQNPHEIVDHYPDDKEWQFIQDKFNRLHETGSDGYVHKTGTLNAENAWRKRPRNQWTCPNCGGPAGPREPGDPRFTERQTKYRYCEDCDTECTSCGYINNDKDLEEAYTGHEKGDPRHEPIDWENYSPECLACGSLLSD